MIGKLGSWIREFTEDQAVSPTQDDEWAAAIAGPVSYTHLTLPTTIEV